MEPQSFFTKLFNAIKGTCCRRDRKNSSPEPSPRSLSPEVYSTPLSKSHIPESDHEDHESPSEPLKEGESLVAFANLVSSPVSRKRSAPEPEMPLAKGELDALKTDKPEPLLKEPPMAVKKGPSTTVNGDNFVIQHIESEIQREVPQNEALANCLRSAMDRIETKLINDIESKFKECAPIEKPKKVKVEETNVQTEEIKKEPEEMLPYIPNASVVITLPLPHVQAEPAEPVSIFAQLEHNDKPAEEPENKPKDGTMPPISTIMKCLPQQSSNIIFVPQKKVAEDKPTLFGGKKDEPLFSSNNSLFKIPPAQPASQEAKQTAPTLANMWGNAPLLFNAGTDKEGGNKSASESK